MSQPRMRKAVIAAAGGANWPRAIKRGSLARAGVGEAAGAKANCLRALTALVRPVLADRTLQVGVRAMASLATDNNKILTQNTVFTNLKNMEYAVRGPLLIRANEIEKELKQGIKKPFTEVIKANVGDAHAMGQQPIKFLRQVLTLTVSPELLNDPSYPEDAKLRAKALLEGCRGGSVGSYSESVGLEIVRKHAAQYIEKRDGTPSDYRNIFLANGASDAIKSVLKLFGEKINGKTSGIMIPIPQYPLYGATISEFGMAEIGYYLDEENKWALSIAELDRALSEAKKTCNPRVLVVINPGNPTGQVLNRSNIEDIIKFAHKHHLFIFADEVYQDNIYDKNCCFHSFKKVMMEMGDPYSQMELASFMSISKGYMGECGIRGGYAELINMDPEVMAVLQKSISAMLCSTVLGQIVMDVVVNPPQPNEPSYEEFQKEKRNTLQSLAERSQLAVDMLNSIPGYKSNPSMGAMYVFPRFEIPPKAIEAAKAKHQEPDLFYAFKLLESTGICIIAGSGFGQKVGTYHFRTTILPQKAMMKSMLTKLKEFHIKFLEEYS